MQVVIINIFSRVCARNTDGLNTYKYSLRRKIFWS